MHATASFKMGAIVQIMRGFGLRFRNGNAEFGSDLGNQFNRLLEIVQDVGPKVQSSTIPQRFRIVGNATFIQNSTFAVPLLPPGVGKVDVDGF